MPPPRRVLVAMSGGVDSAVAAGLLAEQRHELIGVTLHLWDATGSARVGRCCAPEDREDARLVCDHLGIPHYVFDERAAFRDHVVEPFLDAYLAGRTPSPCVRCNRKIKLARLVALADRLGASHVATGHYARIDRRESARPRLLRGLDRAKDQSYFLFGLEPASLARLLFPLGELDKGRTRSEARRMGLPNFDKPESQELCFVPDGDVRGFAALERGPARRGPILDQDGRVLGHHPGIAGFTVGQRRGLGLGGGPPRYVLSILPREDALVVGPEDRLLAGHLRALRPRWLGARPTRSFRATVRIRYRHEPAPARVVPTAAGFHVFFDEKQRAITPGQASVVYRGDEVLGGGFIA